MMFSIFAIVVHLCSLNLMNSNGTYFNLIIFFSICFSLKYLTVYFNRQPFSEIEQWLPRCSNLVSIELFGLLVFSPAAMIRLLTNTGLKSLIVGSDRLDIDQECFEKLVASQLNTLRLGRTPLISGPPLTILDSPLEVNKTVTDLFFNSVMSSTESTEMLYPKYFRGLVHLSISYATDSILQSIFENQVLTNIYSLPQPEMES